MARRRTKAQRDHMEWVAGLGCVISGDRAQLHHPHGGSMKERGVHKGMGQKVSDWLVIPLAERYHTGADGIHTIGVAEWEERYGRQDNFVDQVAALCGKDLWELAREKR